MIKKLSWTGKMSLCLVAMYVVASLMYILSGSTKHKDVSGTSFAAPSKEHLLGTDDLGIDILSQLLFGATISMSIGVSVGVLAGVLGSMLGIFAGFFGGRFDKWIMSVTDICNSIPMLVVLIVLGVFLEFSLFSMIGIMSCMLWMGPTRICRARMLQIRHDQYLLAARSYGASFFYLLRKHLIYALFPMIVVNFLRTLSQAITMEASLAYLGLGDPTLNSWGAMIQQSINYPGIYYTEYWKWCVVPVVVMLVLFMVAVAFIGRDSEKMVNEKLVKS